MLRCALLIGSLMVLLITSALISCGDGGSVNNNTGGQPSATSAIWHPSGRLRWQWQLTTPVDLTVNASMYDIDMFDNDASVVTALHNAGRKAVCS
jgi:hypothetical protein